MPLALDATDRVLKAYLDASHVSPLKLFVSYEIYTEANGTNATRRFRTAKTSVNGTTPVTILAAPPSATVYVVTDIWAVQPNVSDVRLKISDYTGATEDNFVDWTLGERDHIRVFD